MSQTSSKVQPAEAVAAQIVRRIERGDRGSRYTVPAWFLAAGGAFALMALGVDQKFLGTAVDGMLASKFGL